jgi:hypothetical protein
MEHGKIIEGQKHSSLFLEHPDKQRFVVIMPERGNFITRRSILVALEFAPLNTRLLFSLV